MRGRSNEGTTAIGRPNESAKGSEGAEAKSDERGSATGQYTRHPARKQHWSARVFLSHEGRGRTYILCVFLRNATRYNDCTSIVLLHVRGPYKNDSPLPVVGQYSYVHALITAPDGSGFDDPRSYELLGRLRSVLDGIKCLRLVRMPSKHSALNHFCGGRALVQISAACSLVSTYLISTERGHLYTPFTNLG